MQKDKKRPAGQTSILLDAQGIKNLRYLETRPGGFNRSDAMRKWLQIVADVERKRRSAEEKEIVDVVF